MIYVSTNSDGTSIINLTVGDDGTLKVPLKQQSSEEPYELGHDDYLVFNVREKPTEDSPLLIDIESERGSNEIVFTHEDTANIAPGYYSAEVQLMTNDGKRITVWPKLSGSNRTSQANRKNFCLMTEVVYK